MGLGRWNIGAEFNFPNIHVFHLFTRTFESTNHPCVDILFCLKEIILASVFFLHNTTIGLSKTSLSNWRVSGLGNMSYFKYVVRVWLF